MKRNYLEGIIGAIFGAIFMFVLIVVLAYSNTECCKADENANASTNAEYEQIKFTFGLYSITSEFKGERINLKIDYCSSRYT